MFGSHPARRTTLAALAATLVLSASAGYAAAGECPAGKVMAGALTSGPDKPAGVTDTVIASIDLTFSSHNREEQLFKFVLISCRCAMFSSGACCFRNNDVLVNSPSAVIVGQGQPQYAVSYLVPAQNSLAKSCTHLFSVSVLVATAGLCSAGPA